MRKRSDSRIATLALFALFGALSLTGAATIAHWRFEGGTNGVEHANDQDDWYRDLSGNGNHLSSWWDGARPMATDDRPFSPVPLTGAENKLALDFVGDDLGTFGNGGGKMIDSYSFVNGWTVEASFKARALNWQVIVGKDGKRAAGAEAPFWLKIRDFDKRMEVLVLDNADNWFTTATIDPLETGKWYSIAATFDNATKAMKLYLKGEGDSGYVLQGTTTVSAGATLSLASGTWTVGRGMWNNGPADWFNGLIDEVRISDVALEPSEFLNSDGDADIDGMADAWEVQNFGSPAVGAPGADTDSDGLDNFTEYAFGGDPNVDDAAAIYPTARIVDGGDTWEYVYNRRLDVTDNSLAYDLLYKLALTDPDWIPSGGIWETNSGPFNVEAESVTNLIPIGSYGLDQAFVQLQVTDTWKPAVFSQVKNPSPADGDGFATDEGILSWSAAPGAVSYNIYLSTNEAAVAAGDTNVLVDTQSGTTFDASALVDMYKDYHWWVEPVASDPNAVFMPTPVWTFTPTIPAELGRAHRLFVKRGILTSSTVFVGDFGFDWATGTPLTNVTWSTYQGASFNTVNTHSGWLDLLTDTAGPAGMLYTRWCENQNDLLTGVGMGTLSDPELNYVGGAENVVALQAADEENLNDSGWRNAIKAAFDRWKVAYPDTLVYTTQNGPSNNGGIRSFQQYAKPDMAYMFTYEFKSGGNIEQMWKSCRDFREWGKQGIGTVDYAEPIPYGMYYQCHNLQDRHIGQSEMNLGMFGPITYGFKNISGFIYSRNPNVVPDNDLRSELFTSNNDSSPSALYAIVATNNRQVAFMSDALCRLESEAVYDINVTGQDNGDWNSTRIPGLTGISCTPVGGRASGTDKVLIGHFRTLSEKFDGPSFSNQDYFMIMNCDYGVDGTPSEYAQDITLTVDSDLESINLTTGAVETLTRSGGAVTVRLDGGRAKLFKFATGAPFVGFYSGE